MIFIFEILVTCKVVFNDDLMNMNQEMPRFHADW